MQDAASNIGRVVKTCGARLSGVVSCVPKKEVSNAYFEALLGQENVDAVSKMTGVKTRRWTTAKQTTLDLCVDAGIHLLEGLNWKRESVGALIFVSQTPDYRLPASACVMQSKLGLTKNIIAFDVNLGCSAYPYALWLASTFIQSGAVDRVLLAVGDTISKVVDPSDRSTAMLFGDAGTVTALERSGSEISEMTFVLGADGQGAFNLIIPNGASRKSDLISDERFLNHDLDSLFMDGGEVFNFTLKSIPLLAKSLIENSGQSIVEHDVFLFHQANLFMLNHLIKKLKIPADKVPINIQRYGNTSCASIPLLLSDNLKDALQKKPMRIAMFGFGVGYSWGAASFTTDTLNFVDVIES